MRRRRRSPNRLAGRYFAIAGLLVIAIALLVQTLHPAKEQVVPQDAEQVLYALDGDVSASCSSGLSTTVEPEETFEIGADCTITTAAASRAVLVLDWGKLLVLLGPNAELRIEDITRRQVGKALSLRATLAQGKATCWITSSALDSANVRLQAGPAELSAGKGLFEAVAYDAAGARLAVHEGQVRVSTDSDEVTVAAQQELGIESGAVLIPLDSAIEAPERPALPETLLSLPTAAPTQVAAPMLTPAATEATSPTPISTPPGSYAEYTVQPNDTLDGIAQDHGLSWQELWEANQDTLSDPALLMPGDVLRIPEGLGE